MVTVSSFHKGTKDRAPGLVFANMSSHMVSGENYKPCVGQDSFFFRLKSTFFPLSVTTAMILSKENKERRRGSAMAFRSSCGPWSLIQRPTPSDACNQAPSSSIQGTCICNSCYRHKCAPLLLHTVAACVTSDNKAPLALTVM